MISLSLRVAAGLPARSTLSKYWPCHALAETVGRTGVGETGVGGTGVGGTGVGEGGGGGGEVMVKNAIACWPVCKL